MAATFPAGTGALYAALLSAPSTDHQQRAATFSAALSVMARHLPALERSSSTDPSKDGPLEAAARRYLQTHSPVTAVGLVRAAAGNKPIIAALPETLDRIIQFPFPTQGDPSTLTLLAATCYDFYESNPMLLATELAALCKTHPQAGEALARGFGHNPLMSKFSAEALINNLPPEAASFGSILARTQRAVQQPKLTVALLARGHGMALTHQLLASSTVTPLRAEMAEGIVAALAEDSRAGLNAQANYLTALARLGATETGTVYAELLTERAHAALTNYLARETAEGPGGAQLTTSERLALTGALCLPTNAGTAELVRNGIAVLTDPVANPHGQVAEQLAAIGLDHVRHEFSAGEVVALWHHHTWTAQHRQPERGTTGFEQMMTTITLEPDTLPELPRYMPDHLVRLALEGPSGQQMSPKAAERLAAMKLEPLLDALASTPAGGKAMAVMQAQNNPLEVSRISEAVFRHADVEAVRLLLPALGDSAALRQALEENISIRFDDRQALLHEAMPDRAFASLQPRLAEIATAVAHTAGFGKRDVQNMLAEHRPTIEAIHQLVRQNAAGLSLDDIKQLTPIMAATDGNVFGRIDSRHHDQPYAVVRGRTEDGDPTGLQRSVDSSLER